MISWNRSLAGPEIDFVRWPFLQNRMTPSGVGKVYMALNTEAELRQGDLLSDFDVRIEMKVA